MKKKLTATQKEAILQMRQLIEWIEEDRPGPMPLWRALMFALHQVSIKAVSEQTKNLAGRRRR